MLCLGVAATVTVPTALVVLLRCVRGIIDGPLDARVDAIVVAGMSIFFWTIWARAWWDRHGTRVITWAARHRIGGR